MQLALGALELYQSRMSVQMFDEAVKALRQALETEPFEYWNAVEGWVKIDEMREHFDAVGCGTIYKSAGEGRSPLYTAPQSNTSEIWARVDKDGNVTHLDMELCAKGPHNAYTALAISVWNAALEEAARYAAGEGNDLLADSIRELKK
jgi:hypothetical protein